MRARNAILLLLILTGIAAAEDPKPKPVDVKAIRDKLVVLEDAQGGTYVVYDVASLDEGRVFYGATAKTVYEQVLVTRSRNGDAWSYGVWAPRTSGLQPATVQKNSEGKFERFCGEAQAPLKQVPADRAKGMLDKMQFLSNPIAHRSHLLARDDAGVYYYVDKLSNANGGEGYRVFAGKKGSMKQLPLTDVASDSGGEVFSTKSGDVRFVTNIDHTKDTAVWIKGAKKKDLALLDLDANSRVIFKDLGIYGFLGTPCDEL